MKIKFIPWILLMIVAFSSSAFISNPDSVNLGICIGGKNLILGFDYFNTPPYPLFDFYKLLGFLIKIII